jgi:hypothetical protein
MRDILTYNTIIPSLQRSVMVGKSNHLRPIYLTSKLSEHDTKRLRLKFGNIHEYASRHHVPFT